MLRSIKLLATKTEKQTQAWTFLARTLPFIALSFILLAHFLGWDAAYKKSFIVIGSCLFGVAVYWWWWAINKIVEIMKVFEKTEHDLRKVEENIEYTRALIKEGLVQDVGYRQRRKSEDDRH